MADITIEPNSLVLALTQKASTVNTNVVLPDTFALDITQEISSPAFDYILSVGSVFALAAAQDSPGLSLNPVVLPAPLALESSLQSPETIKNVGVVPSATLSSTLSLNDPIIVLPAQIITPDVLEIEAAFQSSLAIVRYAEITPAMHAALIDPYAGGAWLWLVEIFIPGYDTIYLARNTEDVVYSGTVYTKNNFNIGLAPLTGDGSIPRIILNVAQDSYYALEDKINATQGASGGQVQIIRVNENFLAESIEELEQIVNILTTQSDSDYVTFSLGIPSPLLRKIPLRRYSGKSCPYASPGLFKGPECQYAGADNTCTGKYEDCYTKNNIEHWGGEPGLDPNAMKV